ncbi:hypothetical protein HDU96_004425 [Phlyctochytrium bullatum]|nr:hypothetical protein HDU96_004425 [Phlyctochytrium bullatum]
MSETVIPCALGRHHPNRASPSRTPPTTAPAPADEAPASTPIFPTDPTTDPFLSASTPLPTSSTTTAPVWPELATSQPPRPPTSTDGTWTILTDSEAYLRTLERKLEQVKARREKDGGRTGRKTGTAGLGGEVDPVIAYLMEEAGLTPSGDETPSFRTPRPGPTLPPDDDDDDEEEADETEDAPLLDGGTATETGEGGWLDAVVRAARVVSYGAWGWLCCCRCRG